MNARPQRGFTLMELTVAMAVMAVVLVLLGNLLGLMVRADRGTREALAEDQTLERLAEQFRGDVKQADRANLLAEGATLELFIADPRKATYTWSKGALRRVESEGDADAGTVVRQEIYRAIALQGVQFGVDEADPKDAARARFVKLILTRPPLRAEGSPETLEIIAPLGRARRSASAGEKSP